MPRDSHDAYDVDVPSSLSSLSRGQLSRRRLLGGVLSAAAAGVIAPSRVAARGTGLDGAARSTDIRRTNTLLRLGSNENPCGLGPAAKDAFLAAAGEANRYPGRAGQALIDALAAQHKVEPAWIYLTPGSGELLRAATMAFTSPSRSLVVASPTFEAPGRAAAAIGAPVHAVPVTAEGRLDLEGMAAKAAGAGMFFLCNPNNPTGASVPATAVASFVAMVKAAAPEARILVDEAYFEYVDDPGYATAVPLAQADPRVFVTRTFSKIFGMAGLRVGYAIAHPDTIAALRKQGSSGTLSSASLAAAAAALADTSAPHRGAGAEHRRARLHPREVRGGRVSRAAVLRELRDDRHQARRRRLRGAVPHSTRSAWPARSRRSSTCVRLSIGTQAEMDEAVPAMLALLETAPPVSARVAARATDWDAGGAC